MATIVVLGGGMVGLPTAMLLAKDGHDVTVVERDPADPPDPGQAWEAWERRGVTQFRQLHYLMARWRLVADVELPELVAALDEGGAIRYDALGPGRTDVRPGDDVFVTLTARRPVMEAAASHAAEKVFGVTVRRGAAATAVTGIVDGDGVLDVDGVVLDDGSRLRADLVVDAGGRRSPMPTLLTAAGGRAPAEEAEDSGFVYYGRHYRSPDGSLPEMRDGLLQMMSTFSILTLPADRGTWGVGIIAASDDVAMRRVKDPTKWEAVVRATPAAAHWVDAEPLDPEPVVMAKIEDRVRRYVVGGKPVATGVVPVGDAWACTNPSLGRGIAMGLLGAVALRDAVRKTGTSERRELTLAAAEAMDAAVGGWYEATLSFDRARLAEIHAHVNGEPVTPDPTFEITKAFARAVTKDPDALRGFLKINHLVATASEVLTTPGLFEKILEHGSDWRTASPPGPGREEVLALVGAG